MREHIVDTAADLFYRNGIRSTGINTVVAQAGIAKATLYTHFRSKEDLVVAYLRSRHERVLKGFNQIIIEGRDASAIGTVGAIFELLEHKSEAAEFRGCAFIMAASEFSDTPEIVAVAQEHKRAVRDVFFRALEGAASDPHSLSEQLGLVYDGALAAIMIQQKSGSAKVGRAIAMTLLEAGLEIRNT